MLTPPSSVALTTGQEATHQAFFQALVALLDEWLAAAQPYFLPETKSPDVERELSWTWPTPPCRPRRGSQACPCARCPVAWNTSWSSTSGLLQSARMMRAMELLSDPGASVTRTAFDVGFRSLGAFTSAFAARCGETPSEYRARLRAQAALVAAS